MDSYTTETFAPDSMATSIQTAHGLPSRKGVEYEAPNRATILNEGEKRANAWRPARKEGGLKGKDKCVLLGCGVRGQAEVKDCLQGH